MLATIADQPDIEVVGVLEDEVAIAETVERARLLSSASIALRNGPRSVMHCWIVFRISASWRWLRSATARFVTEPYLEIRSHRIENSEAGILSRAAQAAPFYFGGEMPRTAWEQACGKGPLGLKYVIRISVLSENGTYKRAAVAAKAAPNPIFEISRKGARAHN